MHRTRIPALLLALALAACGGGDPDEDRRQLDPPDCKARPESCA